MIRREKQSMGVGNGVETGAERRKRDMLGQDDLHAGAARNLPAGDS